MDHAQVLQAEIDKVIAAGVIQQDAWSQLLLGVWSDGENSPAEADQMFRLLQAINEGRVKTVA